VLGVGVGGVGLRPKPQTPNPQSPIPNPQLNLVIKSYNMKKFIYNIIKLIL